MAQSIMERVAEAKALVPAITPQQAAAIIHRDDVLVVDVRDHNEVAESGKVAGAVHATRGMLEFHADETTPFHNPAFAKHKTILLYCASGGRAALCGKALLDLGYESVRNLGGFKGWVENEGAVETA